MENLQANKKYKIEEGEYKDWLLWIEKYNANDKKLLGAEMADYYLIFLRNPQTSTLYDNFAENWEQVLNECSDYKLSLYVPEKRKLENEIVEFFTQNIPDVQEYVKDSFDGYEDDESVGLYILFPDILRYFEDCVKNRNEGKAKRFIEVLEEFRDKFGERYHKLTTETMDNFIGVAFFEDCVDGFNKEEIDFVLPLFSNRLRNEYNYYRNT